MDPKKTISSRLEFEFLLQAALGLPSDYNDSNTASDNKYADVLFVCFDFENGQQIQSHAASGNDFSSNKILAQAGISIFDPRNLHSSSPKEALTTYNFGAGGCPSRRENVDRRFFFGETIWLSKLATLLPSMEKLLDRSRNIVLVGHGLNGDYRVLQSLGFDLDTSIVGYIDTGSIAPIIFASNGKDQALTITKFRLKDLLKKLGLAVEGCHVAGNDANFTLRALLLLAVESCRTPGLLDKSTKEIVGKFRAIGLDLLPCLSSPPGPRAARKLVRGEADAPIRSGGWVVFGHLLEIAWAHDDYGAQCPEDESTPKDADSRQSQSYDFQQPSALLMQWCPKLKTKPMGSKAPFQKF